MHENLQKLANAVGFATQFCDAGLNRREYDICDNTIRFFAEKLGFKAGSDAEIEKSLQDLAKRRWQQALENIYVVEQPDKAIDLVVPENEADQAVGIKLKNQFYKGEFDVNVEVSDSGETFKIGKTLYKKLVIKIVSDVDVGYYDLTLTQGKKSYKTTLAVAPLRCYSNPSLDTEKLWGFTVQLYSVRSLHNWGIGDFSDLCRLVEISARNGADIIGLNPLSVLVHQYPENASPYASVSRLFLNPIYIDVEAVPEFVPEDKEAIAAELDEVKNSELINYTKVYNLKIKMLERLYQRFLKNKDKLRTAAYAAFCKEQGDDLEKLAAFTVLYDDYCTHCWTSWKKWNKEFQNPNSQAVKKFVEAHEERIGFFKYLQFEADRQFNQAQQLVEKLGLKVGFYRDLPVSVSQDSAEVWGNQNLFIKDAGVGAPPDAFFPQGQAWGLGAFNPFALKASGYEAFIKILRANMHNAGALRIDHVMSLLRLYVIPENGLPGTYIMYNFHDMLNLVAIESWLNRCVIVGESIGNVPYGFLDALARKNINSLSVLWAERWDVGRGDFKPPYDYPQTAFTSVGTHDMAPLRMWWFGYDIEVTRSLGIIPDDESKTAAYKQRELDRWKLLFALDSNGVWPEDNPRKGDYLYGEGYPEGIEEAVHRYIARSCCKAFLAQPEDILHVEKMQNLPGTDKEQHPNWRRKLPVPLERLENDIAFIRNIAAIRKERN